jgi:hypothetical protein
VHSNARRIAFRVGLPLLLIATVAVVLYNATLVDRQPPSVKAFTLSAPAGDPAVGQTLTAIDVRFSEPVRTGTVERRFSITPTVAGTFRWDGDTTLIFTPSDRLPAATTFSVAIAAGYEDLAGNAALAAATDTFSTIGPPTVASVSPSGAGVPVSTTVALTFDRLMATTSVEAAWSEKTITLTFDGPLAFGSTYGVTVSTAATDTDGTHLAAPFTTSFTTVAAGLSVLTTMPVDGVSGTSVQTPIAVVFDRPVDPGTVKNALTIVPPVAGSTTVVPPPSDAIRTASASPSPGGGTDGAQTGSVLLFTPASPLAAHTTYTVTLAPVVAPAGDPSQVAAGRSWTFTTGQPTTSAENQIAFLSDRGGSTDVWLANPDGTNPRQLTSTLGPVVGFDATIDGSRLVYSAGGLVAVQRVDGTDVDVLTGPDRFEYAPTFTPDGGSVLVGRRGADGSDEGYWIEPVPGVGSGGERQVLPDGAPPPGSSSPSDPAAAIDAPWADRAAFDPTGQLLLLAANDGTLRLVTIAPDGASGSRLGLTATTAPVWSVTDDAFLVAGVAPDDPQPAIWRVARTGRLTRLATGLGPVASDGGRGLAFLEDPGSSGALHVSYVDHPGGTPAALTTVTDLSDRSPVFAPDGGRILFVRVGVTAPTTSTGIWIVGTDGSQLEQLTRDGTQPRWLP